MQIQTINKLLSLILCLLIGTTQLSAREPLFVEQFEADTLSSISTTNAAGRRATFTVSPDCETLAISVTDPMGDPLPPFNAFQLPATDENGDRITDITDKLSVSFRVYSREAVNVSVLLRGGDGSMDFRTNRLDFNVPADTTAWTEMTLSWTVDDLAGFDPADFRDVWFYLDRGEENFAGNEIVFDYISIGGTPMPETNSACMLGGGTMSAAVFREYFQGDTLANISRTNAAGRRLNFQLDTACETLALSVIDPGGDPLPPFNAVQVNPVDENGNDITDISGRITVTMRVRSAAAVNVSVLFRSGDGSMENRTSRLAFDVPGDLEAWSEYTLEFGPDEMEGFDPTDLVDMWFYLNRGQENFAGNFFDIDHITIGGPPEAANDSPCNLVAVPTSYAVQFDAPEQTEIIGGGESNKLTLSTNDCEELKIEVTDPSGAPHQAFRPIVINPRAANGNEINNIEGQVEVFIRARSAEAFPIGVLFRSGDGSVENRTATLTQTVAGDLTGWSNLTYTFTEDELGGFTPDDLLDLWIYLDRENANFPGNELYIDYIAIGTKPDTTDNSPCGLPDLMTSTRQASWASQLTVSPNPTDGEVLITLPSGLVPGESATLSVYNTLGQQLPLERTTLSPGGNRIDLGAYAPGVYYLLLTDREGKRAVRQLIRR